MEYKIKVWDRFSRRIIKWETIKDLWAVNALNENHFDILHYTGKDINGESLYEGDIVEDSIFGKSIIRYGNYATTIIGRRFTLVGFYLEKIETGNIHMFDSEYSYIVRGDIYNNPELKESPIR